MIFETERLTIRLLKEIDIEGFHALQANPKVMRYVGGKTMTREENEKDLQQVISQYYKPLNEFWVWGVFSKNESFIGTCALILNDKKEYEIGYRFLEQYWGNGYGTEITKGLINYTFTNRKIERLYAYVDRENTGSVKILNKHFMFEKEFWNKDEDCWERKYSLSQRIY